MKSDETWKYIHAERAALADTMSTFSADQWSTPSGCDGWTVQEAAGHVLAAAEQTPMNFYKKMASAGFRFNVFADRDARRLGALEPEEIISRLRARTTTTNHPPAPVVAMLGEIVVHGEDIRRPLNLTHATPEAALVAIGESWKNTNILIGAKRRIDGVSLQATDCAWSHGSGPDVSGPMISLLLAMSGRKSAAADLTGEGVAVMTAR